MEADSTDKQVSDTNEVDNISKNTVSEDHNTIIANAKADGTLTTNEVVSLSKRIESEKKAIGGFIAGIPDLETADPETERPGIISNFEGTQKMPADVIEKRPDFGAVLDSEKDDLNKKSLWDIEGIVPSQAEPDESGILSTDTFKMHTGSNLSQAKVSKNKVVDSTASSETFEVASRANSKADHALQRPTLDNILGIPPPTVPKTTEKYFSEVTKTALQISLENVPTSNMGRGYPKSVEGESLTGVENKPTSEESILKRVSENTEGVNVADEMETPDASGTDEPIGNRIGGPIEQNFPGSILRSSVKNVAASSNVEEKFLAEVDDDGAVGMTEPTSEELLRPKLTDVTVNTTKLERVDAVRVDVTSVQNEISDSAVQYPETVLRSSIENKTELTTEKSDEQNGTQGTAFANSPRIGATRQDLSHIQNDLEVLEKVSHSTTKEETVPESIVGADLGGTNFANPVVREKTLVSVDSQNINEAQLTKKVFEGVKDLEGENKKFAKADVVDEGGRVRDSSVNVVSNGTEVVGRAKVVGRKFEQEVDNEAFLGAIEDSSKGSSTSDALLGSTTKSKTALNDGNVISDTSILKQKARTSEAKGMLKQEKSQTVSSYVRGDEKDDSEIDEFIERDSNGGDTRLRDSIIVRAEDVNQERGSGTSLNGSVLGAEREDMEDMDDMVAESSQNKVMNVVIPDEFLGWSKPSDIPTTINIVIPPKPVPQESVNVEKEDLTEAEEPLEEQERHDGFANLETLEGDELVGNREAETNVDAERENQVKDYDEEDEVKVNNRNREFDESPKIGSQLRDRDEEDEENERGLGDDVPNNFDEDRNEDQISNAIHPNTDNNNEEEDEDEILEEVNEADNDNDRGAPDTSDRPGKWIQNYRERLTSLTKTAKDSAKVREEAPRVTEEDEPAFPQKVAGSRSKIGKILEGFRERLNKNKIEGGRSILSSSGQDRFTNQETHSKKVEAIEGEDVELEGDERLTKTGQKQNRNQDADHELRLEGKLDSDTREQPRDFALRTSDIQNHEIIHSTHKLSDFPFKNVATTGNGRLTSESHLKVSEDRISADSPQPTAQQSSQDLLDDTKPRETQSQLQEGLNIDSPFKFAPGEDPTWQEPDRELALSGINQENLLPTIKSTIFEDHFSSTPSLQEIISSARDKFRKTFAESTRNSESKSPETVTGTSSDRTLKPNLGQGNKLYNTFKTDPESQDASRLDRLLGDSTTLQQSPGIEQVPGDGAIPISKLLNPDILRADGEVVGQSVKTIGQGTGQMIQDTSNILGDTIIKTSGQDSSGIGNILGYVDDLASRSNVQEILNRNSGSSDDKTLSQVLDKSSAENSGRTLYTPPKISPLDNTGTPRFSLGTSNQEDTIGKELTPPFSRFGNFDLGKLAFPSTLQPFNKIEDANLRPPTEEHGFIGLTSPITLKPLNRIDSTPTNVGLGVPQSELVVEPPGLDTSDSSEEELKTGQTGFSRGSNDGIVRQNQAVVAEGLPAIGKFDVHTPFSKLRSSVNKPSTANPISNFETAKNALLKLQQLTDRLRKKDDSGKVGSPNTGKQPSVSDVVKVLQEISKEVITTAENVSKSKTKNARPTDVTDNIVGSQILENSWENLQPYVPRDSLPFTRPKFTLPHQQLLVGLTPSTTISTPLQTSSEVSLLQRIQDRFSTFFTTPSSVKAMDLRMDQTGSSEPSSTLYPPLVFGKNKKVQQPFKVAPPKPVPEILPVKTETTTSEGLVQLSLDSSEPSVPSSTMYPPIVFGKSKKVEQKFTILTPKPDPAALPVKNENATTTPSDGLVQLPLHSSEPSIPSSTMYPPVVFGKSKKVEQKFTIVTPKPDPAALPVINENATTTTSEGLVQLSLNSSEPSVPSSTMYPPIVFGKSKKVEQKFTILTPKPDPAALPVKNENATTTPSDGLVQLPLDSTETSIPSSTMYPPLIFGKNKKVQQKSTVLTPKPDPATLPVISESTTSTSSEGLVQLPSGFASVDDDRLGAAKPIQFDIDRELPVSINNMMTSRDQVASHLGVDEDMVEDAPTMSFSSSDRVENMHPIKEPEDASSPTLASRHQTSIAISGETPRDIYFVGTGMKLPLQMVKKEGGEVHLSVDIDKLCACKNNSNCTKTQTVEKRELKKDLVVGESSSNVLAIDRPVVDMEKTTDDGSVKKNTPTHRSLRDVKDRYTVEWEIEEPEESHSGEHRIEIEIDDPIIIPVKSYAHTEETINTEVSNEFPSNTGNVDLKHTQLTKNISSEKLDTERNVIKKIHDKLSSSHSMEPDVGLSKMAQDHSRMSKNENQAMKFSHSDVLLIKNADENDQKDTKSDQSLQYNNPFRRLNLPDVISRSPLDTIETTEKPTYLSNLLKKLRSRMPAQELRTTNTNLKSPFASNFFTNRIKKQEAEVSREQQTTKLSGVLKDRNLDRYNNLALRHRLFPTLGRQREPIARLEKNADEESEDENEEKQETGIVKNLFGWIKNLNKQKI
ncbi:unnamed protein product [Acanthoscelides obtectus]|uniref:Uncharacterized protein n=1 Tax=Acanthoscelides obtectus TaxID=200917 RepID=A0A9P0K0J1_ACAOB|nr:unnamed protein product [Acanthoscelides obtectus]CAK1638144.1 hypothetical protein AOBTE_LOCUS10409 [Acanthoscelides obtectus]